MIHYLVVGIIDVIFGATALIKQRNRATYTFAILAFSIAFWTFELYVLSYLPQGPLLAILYPLFRAGMFLISPALAHLTWQLIGQKTKPFFHWVVVPGWALGISLALWNLISPAPLRTVDNGFLPTPDLLYALFIADFVICFLGSIIFSLIQYRKVTTRARQKIKWLLISLISTFLFSCIAIYMWMFHFYLTNFIGIIPNLVFVSSLLYATIKHDLMDIRNFLSEVMARLLILSMIGLGIYTLFSQTLPTYSSSTSPLLFLVILGLCLEFYPRLLKWLIPNTQRLLDASHFDFEQITANLSYQLQLCTRIPDLMNRLDYVFYHILKVDSYELFGVASSTSQSTHFSSIIRPQHQLAFMQFNKLTAAQLHDHPLIMLDEASSELKNYLDQHYCLSCLPIRHQNNTMALLFIGRTLPLTHFYRYDDLRLLNWLSPVIGQALEHINNLHTLQVELMESKKKLSLLSIMNLYHHDIKAPLAIIDGLISNDLYDEEKRRSIILEQVARGSQLITTMANLLNGKRKIKVTSVDLELIIADCIALFKHTIPKLNLTYQPISAIQGDADDLKILFINLLKNAYEARRPGIELYVEVKIWEEREYCWVTFSDNGVGMDDEQVSRLWTENTSQKTGGSGIGTQAIKHIADEHKAQLTVHSQLNVGTQFTLGFPKETPSTHSQPL